MRNMTFTVAGWLGAAGAAVLVGMLALLLIDGHVTGKNTTVISQHEAAQALATEQAPTPQAGSPTPVPTHETTPQTTPPQSSTRVLGSTGGTIVARCQPDDLVQLLSWTPRQGYEVDEAVPGPATTTYVSFEAEDTDVIVTISCSGTVPTQQEIVQPDD